MKITRDTKIGKLLEMDERMQDWLVSLSPAFKKLTNPLLRKHVAPRVSIKDAARIGGLTANEFLRRLEEAGYEVEYAPETGQNPSADDCKQAERFDIQVFDARPFLDEGKDPFLAIQEKLRALGPGEALEVVLDFAPLPLIDIFGKAGYHYCMRHEAGGTVHTLFFNPENRGGFWRRLRRRFHGGGRGHRAGRSLPVAPEGQVLGPEVLEQKRQAAGDKIRHLDVRGLEMPQPMMQILEALPTVGDDEVLFVEHERIPQYLLPELEKRGFSIAARTAPDGHVQLLIFKNKEA